MLGPHYNIEVNEKLLMHVETLQPFEFWRPTVDLQSMNSYYKVQMVDKKEEIAEKMGDS